MAQTGSRERAPVMLPAIAVMLLHHLERLARATHFGDHPLRRPRKDGKRLPVLLIGLSRRLARRQPVP